MGNRSELQTQMRELIAQGYSEAEAKKMALKEWGQNLLLDVAGGALSGGMFGSVKSGIDSVMPKLKQEAQAQPTVADITPTPQRAQEAPATSPVTKVEEVQPVQSQTASERNVSDVVSRITGENKTEQAETTVETAAQAEPTIEFADGTKQTEAEFVEAYRTEFPRASEAEAAKVFRQYENLNENGIKVPAFASEGTKAQPEATETEPDVKPAMGAADYGFSGPIGSWKRDADTFIKDTEIPKHDQKGRTISDSAGSMFSANVPNETKEYIERMSYLGKFNVGHDTNRAQVQRVHDAIAKDGFDNVYTKTIADIEAGKASGDLTARAWVLFVQAANRGESAKAATLAKVINKNAGNAAHALQANAIYYKLSPEGRYASIARTVDKINEELSNEGRKGSELYDVPESDKLKVTKAIEDERETALRLLENLHKAFSKKGRNHGIPVELWSTEVGNQLASVLEKNKKPGSARPQTVAKALRRDLQIFAQNYMSKNAPAGTQYNAARALENFLNNREQYQEAWKQAQVTLQEKYADDPAMLEALQDFMADDISLEQLEQGIDRDIAKAIREIGTKTAEIIRSNKSDKEAVANQIKDMLMKDHRLLGDDAQRMADFIVDRFNARINAAAEKALENYVTPRDKKAQKTLDQRFREMVNMGAFSGSNYADQVAEKLFGNVVKLDPDLIERYKNTTDPDDIRELEKEIYKSVGRQIPSNFKDKWNAWRHMGMLGTFKAPERNFIGNTAGQVMRVTKNAFSGAGQALFVDKSERTRAVLPAGRELVQAAKNDIKNVEQELKGIGKNHIVNDQIQEGKQIFTPHLANTVRKVFPELPEWADNISVEGARKLINKAMSDGVFSKGTYVDTLSSFLKARGYTAADFTGDGMTEAQKAEAREYAISEALKATYRDRSVISELITSARFNPNKAKSPKVKMAMEVANAGLEGIMPYLKTPANILARGIEYDPILGTVSTIINAYYAKKQGDFKAADMIDDISKVLTGGAIATIGYFMRANNMIKGSSDDEDQEDLEGRQEYSLMAGDKSIPIDWMAPFCMPLFMGVELYDMFDRAGDGSAPLTSKIAGSLTSLSSAMLNTSMLDGLQDMIDNVKYADRAPIALVANAALGYLGQGVPTLFGQLERAFNSPVQEMTFIDKNNKWFDPDAQRALGTLSKKIPGWDYNQIPYIDRWGRTVDNGGVGKRIVNQLFNPANTSEIKETPVDAEIKRLEQVLGDGYNLTPAKAQSTITIDEKQIILTADEYITYAQAKGQNDLTFRQNLIDSDAYLDLDDAVKAASMQKSADFADALAKMEAGFKPDIPDWQAELVGADAETITNTLVAKAIESQLGTGSKKYEGMADYAADGDLEAVIKLMLTDAQAADYDTHIEKADVSLEVFLDALAFASEAKSDKKDGETVPGSKKAKVEDYINSLDLSKQQKTALYLSMPDDYSQKTMPKWQ
jgi:hypothetical protein